MNEWPLIILLAATALITCALMIYPLAKDRLFNLAFFPPLVFVAFLGYQHWGSYQSVHTHLQQEKILKSLNSPEELIEKLRKKLDNTPASAKGWYLLGRLYSSQNQPKKAERAFAVAYGFFPDNEQYAVNYALILWVNNGRAFNDQIRLVLRRVVDRNPDSRDAVRFLALDRDPDA